eukprot:470550-Hanusia_phi.AAC.6
MSMLELRPTLSGPPMVMKFGFSYQSSQAGPPCSLQREKSSCCRTLTSKVSKFAGYNLTFSYSSFGKIVNDAEFPAVTMERLEPLAVDVEAQQRLGTRKRLKGLPITGPSKTLPAPATDME